MDPILGLGEHHVLVWDRGEDDPRHRPGTRPVHLRLELETLAEARAAGFEEEKKILTELSLRVALVSKLT